MYTITENLKIHVNNWTKLNVYEEPTYELATSKADKCAEELESMFGTTRIIVAVRDGEGNLLYTAENR